MSDQLIVTVNLLKAQAAYLNALAAWCEMMQQLPPQAVTPAPAAPAQVPVDGAQLPPVNGTLVIDLSKVKKD